MVILMINFVTKPWYQNLHIELYLPISFIYSHTLEQQIVVLGIKVPLFVRILLLKVYITKQGRRKRMMLPTAAAAAKSLQSCPTLCDPIDSSPPGSTVLGILQARTLEWVAISSSNAWKWKVKVKLLSRVRLFVTPWTAAHQAPPSLGFSRQEYWSEVPLPSLDAS